MRTTRITWTLANFDTSTFNSRKCSLSVGSSSDLAPSDHSEAASYASVVKAPSQPVPSQRRRRIFPAVILERACSRYVSHVDTSCSVDDSSVSPSNV